MRCEMWDVTNWLPVESSDLGLSGEITALDGKDCWHWVFQQSLFNKFVTRVVHAPAHVILW